MGPSEVERPRRLNLTKSDFYMPDKLDTRPNDLTSSSLCGGYGTMPGAVTEVHGWDDHHKAIQLVYYLDKLPINLLKNLLIQIHTCLTYW